MSATNVRSKWVDGNLVFTKKDGTEIATFNGTTGKLVMADDTIVGDQVADGSLTTDKLAVPKYGSISEEVAVGDFTDGGGTSGYIDLTAVIPKGAIPLGFKADVKGAFDGDTSAVVKVGVSGDTDRFSADTTGDVFTKDVTVGSVAVAGDACKGIDDEVTVRVTVTGDSDFTDIKTEDNGAMIVTIYYIATE